MLKNAKAVARGPPPVLFSDFRGAGAIRCRSSQGTSRSGKKIRVVIEAIRCSARKRSNQALTHVYVFKKHSQPNGPETEPL